MNKFHSLKRHIFILIALLVFCFSMIALGACKSCSCNPTQDPEQQGQPENPDSEQSENSDSGHMHKYTEAFTPATCTDNGIITYTCQCGNSYNEIIPATGHSLNLVSESSAHFEQCENCDYATAKVSHSYEQLVSSKQSTCTVKGSRTAKCVCGAEYTEELPLINHSFTKLKYDSEGHFNVCSVCETPDSGTAKQAHRYSSKIVTERTCTQSESTKFSCDCGYFYTATTQEAAGHELDRTQFAKRTPSGHFYKCDKCGNDVLELHESVDAECPDGFNREATCYREGHQDRECTICNLVYHDTIPKTDDHNFSTEWTSNGTFHWHVCLNGDGQCSAKGDEAQHTFGVVRNEPTCTETGNEYKQCECGRIQSGSNRTLPAAGHDYEETVLTPATCSQTGEVKKVCRVCDDTVIEPIAMLNHSWTIWDSDDSQHWHICADCNTVSTSKGNHNFRLTQTVQATCRDDGYKLEVCTACEHEKRTVLPAHHVYRSTDVGRVDPTCTEFGSHFEICDACGDTITVVDELLGYADHDIVYYPKKEATSDTDGNRNYWQCRVCGKYFSSSNCENELTEDEVFIRAPKTHEVETISELKEIAFRDYNGVASSDRYKITLTVFEVEYSCLCLTDSDDLLEINFFDETYNLSTISEGDIVTVRGYLIADGEEITLCDADILSVDCGDDDLVDLIFSISGDIDYVILTTTSDLDCNLDIVNYGYVSNLYNYHCLYAGEETLTLHYQNYYGSVIVNTLVINGKSYTMAGGELTVDVTESLYIEIDFRQYDKATNVTTVEEIDTSWNAEITVNPYVSYAYVNGNNDSGHIVKGSYLRFYVENAYITRIEIEFENYELTNVAKNTISVGTDESRKSAINYTLSGTRATLNFDKSDKFAFFEYSANACQARIASIKIYYNTYNT